MICRSTGDEYTGCLYAGIMAAAQGDTLTMADTGEILAMTSSKGDQAPERRKIYAISYAHAVKTNCYAKVGYSKGGVANCRKGKTHNPAAIMRAAHVLERKKFHVAQNWKIWAA